MQRPVALGSVLVALLGAYVIVTSLQKMLSWTDVAANRVVRAIISGDEETFRHWIHKPGALGGYVQHPSVVMFPVHARSVDFDVQTFKRETTPMTPLMLAVFYDRAEMAEKLIRMGASVDAMRPEDPSALWLARTYNRQDILKLLRSVQRGG